MELKEEIRNIIAGVLEMTAEELAYDAEMEYVEGWDSMHNVMILSALEDHYDIMFPDEDIFDLVSVDAFVEEIAKLKA